MVHPQIWLTCLWIKDNRLQAARKPVRHSSWDYAAGASFWVLGCRYIKHEVHGQMDICTHEQTSTLLHSSMLTVPWNDPLWCLPSIRHSSTWANSGSKLLQISCITAEMSHVWATCLCLSCLLDSIKSLYWKSWAFVFNGKQSSLQWIRPLRCQIKSNSTDLLYLPFQAKYTI